MSALRRAANPAKWINIPAELKERSQWLLATHDAKGALKVPASLDATGHPIAGSSTDSRTWLDFDTACKAAAHYGLAIGYVVAPDDPFCCIDLDVKTQANEADASKWSSEAEIALCYKVMQQLDSYTERSQSGQGLHIWVLAKIGEGVKRKPVEVYSQGRFLVCTGDVLLALPIRERQVMVDLLVSEARQAQQDTKAELDEDAPERYSDEEIVERLGSHSNCGKYFALYRGEWESLGYPSQSEADLSLMSFYTFYSENEEQCRRLFRMSKLGQREKATKNNVYLNRTLRVIRGRQQRDHALEAHGAKVADALLNAHAAQAVASNLCFPTAEHPAERELQLRRMSTVKIKAIDWLWPGWVPKGYITIWAGESGAGKSTVLADVAARVTTGAPWPGEAHLAGPSRGPGRVLWLGSEDGAEEMTLPRLIACGANCENIVEIQGVVQSGKRCTFSLQDDLVAAERQLARARSAGEPFDLLVIDPVTSYLPGRALRRVDLNDAGQLRSILEPWMSLAQRHGLAVVCVTHFTKDTTRSMLHRVMGSAAFAQTCRSLCAVVGRPDDGPFSKLLLQVKVNLPEHPGGAWKFSTVKVRVGTDDVSGRPVDATRPEWEELDTAITPESLAIPNGKPGPESSYAPAFGIWVAMQFAGVPESTALPVSQLKARAIAAKVATESWWKDHCGEFLERRNVGGTWLCRPLPRTLNPQSPAG